MMTKRLPGQTGAPLFHRLLSLVLALALCAGLLPALVPTAQAAGLYGRVLADETPVLTGADAGSEALLVLNQDVVLPILDLVSLSDGTWYQVSVGEGQVGWLPEADFLPLSDAEAVAYESGSDVAAEVAEAAEIAAVEDALSVFAGDTEVTVGDPVAEVEAVTTLALEETAVAEAMYAVASAAEDTAVDTVEAAVEAAVAGYVRTKQQVNVRSTPIVTTSNGVGQLGSSVVVPYLFTRPQQDGGSYTWYYIQTGSLEGFVREDLVELSNADGTPLAQDDSALMGVAALRAASLSDGALGFVKVVKGSVKVRSTAEIVPTNILAGTNIGDVLTFYSVISQGGYSWYYVKAGSTMGYVRGDNLKECDANGNILNTPTTAPTGSAPTRTPAGSTTAPTQSSATATPSPAAGERLGYAKVVKYSVRVRTTPEIISTNIITGVSYNQVVEFYAVVKPATSDYSWYYVRVGSAMGYVRGDNLKECDASGHILDNPTTAPTGSVATATPSPTRTSAVTATPTPTEAPVTGDPLGYGKIVKYSVRLRLTPEIIAANVITSMTYGQTYPYYAVVKPAGSDYTWYYMKNGNVMGYVRGDNVQETDAQGQPTVGPTMAPTGSIATPTPTRAPSVTATPTAAPTVDPGQRLGYVKVVKYSVRIRLTPEIVSTNIIAGINYGQVAEYYAVVRPANSAYNWYYVSYKGTIGYVRGDNLVECDEHGNTITNPTAAPTGSVVTPTPTRTSSQPTPTPTPVATTPVPSRIGYLKVTHYSVILRNAPAGSKITNVAYNEVVEALGTPVGDSSGTGYTWTLVRRIATGEVGYVRSDLMISCDQNGNPITTATPSPTSRVTPSPTPVGTATATPPAGTVLGYIRITGSYATVRASASTAAAAMGRLSKGDTVPYLSLPVTVGNYQWYYVRSSYGNGYVRADLAEVVSDGSPTTAPTATVTPPSGTGNYAEYYTLGKTNTTGDAVTALTRALKAQGYYTGSVTSTYTSAVTAAVKKFQQAKGLTADGIAWPSTQHALFGTQPYPTGAITKLTMNIYKAEKIDWYTGGIQDLWPKGTDLKVYDVYTGIVWWAHRWSGGAHADVEPLTAEDTARLCQIYGVSTAEDIEKNNLWQRRPCLVTIGTRTFACSLYGVPHNPEGDTIHNNNMGGQVCLHFTNSRTHGSNRVDENHEAAINYAWTHAPNGYK